MSSRDQILAALTPRSSTAESLPGLPESSAREKAVHSSGLIAQFSDTIRSIGGEVEEVASSDLDTRLRQLLAEGETGSALKAGPPGSIPVASDQDPHMLDPLKVMVCRGTLGVAENGAVWLRESDLGNRAAPFITEHLILVLDKSRLVPDLFTAYEQLQVNGEGFGLFVAGPSKTADIEQSLVLGAHGPKRHTVILLDDKVARTNVHTSKDV